MNYFAFIVKSALFNFSRSKGRTFLTSLGILIGVMAVVLLTAFGLGLKKYINDQFQSLGTNVIRIMPGKVLSGGSFNGSSIGSIRFDEKDVNNLKRIRNLESVAPIYTKSIAVDAGKKKEDATLYSTSAEIFNILNFNAQSGKIFDNTDVDKRNKIAVIGPKIADKLFGSGDLALGKNIKIDSQSFKVTGVLESKGGGGFGGPDLDALVFIPYKTGFVFNTDKKFFIITAKGKENISLDTVKQQIQTVLLKRYKEDEFSVLEQTEILKAVTSIFDVLNMVLVAIAAISLVVGGIGIMNIMYVTVTEKIKEIGIRRALGAKKNDILFQFLVEAVILSVFGGLLGLGLSFFIILLIQKIFPAYIDAQAVLLALGVSTLIGVVFGVFPAKQAADLSPIDAIRYE